MPATTDQSNLFALLIGIDHYSQKPLPDGSYYPHLGGCVRDINHVEQMLRTRLSLPDERITKLISVNPPPPAAKSDARQILPTYENLVKAFQDVTKQARAGDQIYIHYSGHGGRSATMFEALKGERGLDESIVPCDIGENAENPVCYLRDIEMAYLLKAMSDEGLIVTLVLDSCHSGGATRGNGGAVPRGITSIDTRKPPNKSAVASIDAMVEAFRQMPPSATRSVSANVSGWGLPTPKNCTILAACRANELANEFAFGGGTERNGALTYWMLDALKQFGAGYTYKMLYDRVVAKVHSKFVDQTPQLEGESNRELFGGIRFSPASVAVNVLKIDFQPPNKRIKLNTGLAQGVGKGSRFAVYAANAADFTDSVARLAVVELDNPGATETWANVIEDTNGRTNEIEEGAQAVLLGVGMRLRGRVKLVSKGGVFGDAAAQDDALAKLREVIPSGESVGEAWIRLAEDDEGADFQVAVNFNGEYEIWDANGRTLPNMRPALKINADGATEKVVQRLTHLTKYRNARLIDNTDATSALARKIVLEIGKPKITEMGETVMDEITGKPFFEPLGLPLRPMAVGEEFLVRVTNNSKTAVNVAVLDLQPDWGISQAYPDPRESDYELLEPGAQNALLMPVSANLPDDYQEGSDTLKVFATAQGTSFHWLELPALDQPPPLTDDDPAQPGARTAAARTRGSDSPVGNALEQLLEAFAEPKITRQIVSLAAPKGGDWTTTQVEVRVRRASIAHVADPALSLLQSAFEENAPPLPPPDGRRGGIDVTTRSVGGGRRMPVTRAELNNPFISQITQYCVAAAQNQLTTDELVVLRKNENGELEIPARNEAEASAVVDASNAAQQRGVVDTVKYCASLAVGMAKNLWAAKISGDTTLYDQYHAALTKRMGDCDPNYQKAITQFLKFLKESGHVPYRAPVRLSDYVIDGRLPSDGVVGVVADWATGEPESLEVLRQVAEHKPHAAIHLGDIYYAGTAQEVENYFYQPWKNILKPETSGVLSLALPGNHDLYAGGVPYYDLIDRLAALNGIADKPASYFCLRNDDWQLIGLDTALHDRLGGGPTYLEDSEVAWLKDKMDDSGGRRTILLSHHQLLSANDQFDGRGWNDKLYQKLKPFLSQVDLWLWGHEHDLVVFEEYEFKDDAGNVETSLKRGRCIGGSAFPVGNFEMPSEPKNPDVRYHQQVALSKGSAFYQHCYTVIKFNGRQATVLYYEDRDGGRLLFQEEI